MPTYTRGKRQRQLPKVLIRSVFERRLLIWIINRVVHVMNIKRKHQFLDAAAPKRLSRLVSSASTNWHEEVTNSFGANVRAVFQQKSQELGVSVDYCHMEDRFSRVQTLAFEIWYVFLNEWPHAQPPHIQVTDIGSVDVLDAAQKHDMCQ